MSELDQIRKNDEAFFNSIRRKPTYPPDHKPGMRVPKGGSNCAKCEYLKDAAKRICGNSYFIKWNGSNVIPGQIDSYCSDWFETAKGPSTRISQLARANG